LITLTQKPLDGIEISQRYDAADPSAVEGQQPLGAARGKALNEGVLARHRRGTWAISGTNIRICNVWRTGCLQPRFDLSIINRSPFSSIGYSGSYILPAGDAVWVRGTQREIE
jgi:hypothetical protein